MELRAVYRPEHSGEVVRKAFQVLDECRGYVLTKAESLIPEGTYLDCIETIEEHKLVWSYRSGWAKDFLLEDAT